VGIIGSAFEGGHHRLSVQRLALFGSCARGEQRPESDIDVLVEVEPTIGLRVVDPADRIEALLGAPTDVASRRAITARHWALIEKDVLYVA
jgi:uncharacterized protein